MAEAELRDSEARYRSLFKASPVAMWEEDHSLVKRRLDELMAQGVKDVEAHLHSHPDEYAELVRSVEVLDTNAAAVELFEAAGPDDLRSHANDLELSSEGQHLGTLWSALLAGIDPVTYESVNVSLAGHELHLVETCTVAPGNEATWARVFIVDVEVTQIKRSEASLRRTQQAIETASDDFYAVDPEGRFTYVNRAAARSLRRSQEELIGMAPWEIVPALTEEQWRANWQTLRSEGVVRREAVHSTADGQLFPVEVTSNFVVLDDGEYEFTHVHDITERKRADKALRDREARYRALFEDSPAAMWEEDHSQVKLYVEELVAAGVEDLAGYLLDHPEEYERCVHMTRTLNVNQAAAELFEATSLEQLIERADEVNLSTFTRNSRFFWAAMAAGQHVAAYENPALTLAGHRIELAETAMVAPGHEESFDRVYVTDSDITERKRAEAALQASEARYRRIVETAAEGIIMLDAERRMTYVNEELCRLCGYQAEELTGASLDVVLLPKDVPAQLRLWAERQAGATGRYEIRLRRKDGSPRWVGISGAPVLDEQGEFAGGLAMVTDIHERKRAEERSRGTLERLRLSVDAAVNTLARTIEIRDPYTAGHQERVSELTAAIGERLKLPKRTLTSLRIASLIHDLGKIAVPAEILSKPGALSEVEWTLIQQHPETGFEILREMRFPGPVATIVRDHHERLDGSGYPRGLVGDEISLQARILAVADVVEAMASHRPYRAALGVDAALGFITEHVGDLFDELVVSACLELVREDGFGFGRQP